MHFVPATNPLGSDHWELMTMASSKASSGTIDELWRYPVKSMGGERLEVAHLAHSGLGGEHPAPAAGRRSLPPSISAQRGVRKASTWTPADRGIAGGTGATLTLMPTHFIVDEGIEASVNGEKVFSRRWLNRIPRDGN